MQDAEINYQQHLHVTAVDVDSRAAHMAYVQLALLNVPAVVIVGNTLTLEEREHGYKTLIEKVQKFRDLSPGSGAYFVSVIIGVGCAR